MSNAYTPEVLEVIEAAAVRIVPIIIANGMSTISNSFLSLELLEAYKMGVEHVTEETPAETTGDAS